MRNVTVKIEEKRREEEEGEAPQQRHVTTESERMGRQQEPKGVKKQSCPLHLPLLTPYPFLGRQV